MPTILLATLVTGILESSLQGIYTVLYGTAVYLFYTRPGATQTRLTSIPLFLGLFLQFLATTAHWINSIYQLSFGFVNLGGGVTAEAFFISLQSQLAQIILYTLSGLIADSLVIHRLFVVWSPKRIVLLLPLVALIMQAVATILGVFQYRNGDTFQNNGVHTLSNGWVITSIVLSLLQVRSPAVPRPRLKAISNDRPMGVQRAFAVAPGQAGGRTLMSVLTILVESAAIQTSTLLCVLVTFKLGSIALVGFLGTAPAILAISTILIHVRVGLGWAHNSDRGTARVPSTVVFAVNAASSEQRPEFEPDGHEMKRVIQE
ncbi:hypothetical protein GGX14DRAFT_383873 [Mycena pura]|uniref:Uncharacterized protein n=1 Tax=Mycena pura TaxID=153505 RepID=A0AAD6YUS3_9AGAR|nr:hypothetical protein GGX14DRAFT_383873 [Mycena pura]